MAVSTAVGSLPRIRLLHWRTTALNKVDLIFGKLYATLAAVDAVGSLDAAPQPTLLWHDSGSACRLHMFSSFTRLLQRIDSVFSVDPSLAKVPPEVRQAAIRLLNRVTNGVDRLLSLRPTKRGWVARFLENGKPVEATWDGRELVTVLLSDLTVPRARYNARRDARKNCVKGRWCVGKTGRGTCIAAYRKCKQQLKEQEMAAADRLSEALRQAAAQGLLG